MKRITQIVAIVTALSAFPALAEEGAPVAGSSRDPFSQTYTGRDPQQQKEAKPCDRACSCGRHQAPKSTARKAEAPRFTDAG